VRRAVQVPGLEVSRIETLPRQIEVQPVLVRLEHHPHPAKAFQDLDPERAHGRVRPIGAQLAGGSHHAMDAPVIHHREGVGHAEVRVPAHAGHEQQPVVACVAVEVVPVVEVAVARPHVAGGLRDLVHGEVVQR